MTHPIIKDLQSRYTSKRYDPSKRIPQADMDVIYEALRLSASSINSQPWKFIIIESDEAKQRMHDSYAKMHQFNQPHIKAASHTILFAHNPSYKRENYGAVIDQMIRDGRAKPEERDAMFGAFAFVDLNTDDNGDNSAWTRSQTYLALGNILHTLARLGIDSTTMEGVDSDLIGNIFADELQGHVCSVALAMGYHMPDEDYNASLPKSRLPMDDVVKVL